jgi:hypothetical protein
MWLARAYRPIRVTGVGRPQGSFCFRGPISAESVRRRGRRGLGLGCAGSAAARPGGRPRTIMGLKLMFSAKLSPSISSFAKHLLISRFRPRAGGERGECRRKWGCDRDGQTRLESHRDQDRHLAKPAQRRRNGKNRRSVAESVRRQPTRRPTFQPDDHNPCYPPAKIAQLY